MGYGVHECAKEGSRDVILLFGETPCEYLHSHLDEQGNIFTHAHEPEHSCSHKGCSHAKHDSNCCHTLVYTVTSDQTVSDNSNLAAFSANFISISTPVYNSIKPLLFTNSFELSWLYMHKEKLCENDIYLINNTFLV